jgi:RND family efflux transporter MFP subunit
VKSEHHHDYHTDVKALRSGRGLRWIGVIALGAAISAAVIGIIRRQQQHADVAQVSEAAAIPTVAVTMPKRGVSGLQLVLPGDIQAWYEAPIYARVSGYLKNWYRDYGASVKAGDVLAVIDAPDLDGQFAAATAKLNSMKAVVKVRQAEMDFAKTTYDRWRESPKGVVSEQETMAKKGDFDSAAARLDAAIADVKAAEGDVERLQALQQFKQLTAPFDGTVTERNTDIGALINAGSGVGGGTGPVLFRVADVHKMRIFVQVPQQSSADIREGLKAQLYLPQYPEKTFKAEVATTAAAINMASRTLLVELHAENPDRLLQPGTYAEVRFDLPSDPNMVQIPTSALLFRSEGLQVAVIHPDNKIELRKITLGRNLGAAVEVVKGLTPSERIVDSPPDSLAAGDVVHVAGEPAEAKEADLKTEGLCDR